MYKSILFAAVCALTSLACEVSCFEDCDDAEPERGKHAGAASGGSAACDDAGGSAHAPGTAGSANAPGTGGSTNAGTGGQSAPPPTACTQESDCGRGFNCDYERKQCVAAGAETCAELETEADCDNRNDCVSIYAGTHCSCGPECTCVGGEPGCVCESFAFFRCEPLAR